MANDKDFTPGVEDFFNNEFSSTLKIHRTLKYTLINGIAGEFVARENFDIHTNAKFSSYYIRECKDLLSVCTGILMQPEIVAKSNEGVLVFFGSPTTRTQSINDMVSTKKVFFYIDDLIPQEVRHQIESIGQSQGMNVEIREKAYAQRMHEGKKPLAFLSHDSRNKKNMARPLAAALNKLLCRVWYDEYSLRPGQSLRESIEKGLKECKKCVVLLTRQYLANKGWAKAEFDSIFTRERIEKERVVIPVWFRVSAKEVYNYCPLLADAVAIHWINHQRVNEVAGKISKEIDDSK